MITKLNFKIKNFKKGSIKKFTNIVKKCDDSSRNLRQ